ncbi:MAG TPA: S9 family peptidase [Gemmatimonadales bacterium]|nr:S9 family peptidase [Gemmatimonadales bacterium]
MRCIRTLTLATLAGALVSLPAAAQEKARFASLEEALRSGGALFGSNGPANVNWIDGGARYSYITRGADGEEIRAADPATGKDTLLFSAKGLTFPGTTEPFSYQSFQWSQDSKYLVFQANFKQIYRRSGTADYFVYSLADRSLKAAAKGARTAELSPDGTMLGLERGGDMYVYDMASGKETRLTSDAHGTVYNGHFDWVYEEEFGLAQAWNWSPDDRYLAYWQLDEGPEPTVQFTDYAGIHPVWDTIRIPQPGDSNPTVRIGVSDVKTGKQVWLDTGEGPDTYIPRIYWTSEKDTLAVVTLDRHQNQMKLFFFNVTTGGRRLVMTDRSSTWIDVFDFYAGVQDMLSFPAGTREFFWLSDRDGFQHIYRFDYSGKLLNQVTSGKWEATRIEGTDPKTRTIYYVGTEASPLERQLYAVRFDGSHSRRLTTATGTHSIDMSPSTRYYIDRWSSVSTPRQVELWATGGKMLKKIEDNAKVTAWVASHEYSPTKLFNFTTSDGVKLDGSMVLPVPFDSTRRYPVVFAVYGGPGSQQVYNSWGGGGYGQWLAQHGYIVVGLNNRGTNNYGSAFMKVVYKHLGQWESHDFAEAARYLATLPYVDGKRVAIMGTSYGGYSTVYTMAKYPDLFTVGVANSAVTDWRLYDDIYTERYMSLPSDNAAGYDSSSAVVLAPRLTGHLLLIHSMMDDNVHPQNTMQFLTAMANAGHDVDLRIYPPGHHGAAYNFQSFLLIQQATDEWLGRWLKP